MKNKNLKTNSSKKFKRLTVANMVIAWIFLLSIIALCFLLIQSEIKFKDKYFYYKGIYRIIILAAALTFLCTIIGLSAAQSVMAKRLGRITQSIGYEQVICIPTMLIGFAAIIGLIGVGLMFLLPVKGRSEDPTVILHEHMVMQAAIGCYLLTSLTIAGFASYNSILCAKAK